MTSNQILLVEDDLISRMALKEQIQDLKLGSVSEAKNDVEVFNLADQKDFDIILMDVQLRNSRTGIEICKELQGKGLSVPFVFVTGNSDHATFQEILKTTPHAILGKPVDITQLRNAILTGIANKQATDRKYSLNSDKLLSLIYETAKVGMCVTDDQGNFVRVNQAYCENYGYEEKELIGQNFTKVLPAEMHDHAQKIHNEFIFQSITEMPSEWHVKTKDGKIKDVFVTAGRMVNEDNKVYKVTTVTDITDRKNRIRKLQKSLDEREVLEKEIFHRVKNNLNMVVSLFQLQKSRISENSEALGILSSGILRVKSLALLHEKLYKQGDVLTIDVKDYITQLSNLLLDGNELKNHISINLEDYNCDLDTAVSIGLIVNELQTNVIKHAFDDEQKDKLIELMLSDDQNQITLEVRDNGTAIPDDFLNNNWNSLGIQMINSLTDQLNGSFDFRNDEGMKCFSISFPKTI